MSNSIEAWLRRNGIKCTKVRDASPSDAISILKEMAGREWRKARVYPDGLLVLHSTSPTDASLTGVFFAHLNCAAARATAEALSPLMITPSTDMLMQGILDHPNGCLIEGLGTAQVVFSSL